jgi:hypothetical protein
VARKLSAAVAAKPPKCRLKTQRHGCRTVGSAKSLASLVFIEGAKPRDELESALVIQMAFTHSAAMAVLNRLGGAAGDRTVAAMASAAA